MGKTGGFWLNRIKSQRKVRSPRTPRTPQTPWPKAEAESPKKEKVESEKKEEKVAVVGGGEAKPSPAIIDGKKVMIVVDLSSESKNALQWALSHCVQDEDNIVLLYVIKLPKQATPGDEMSRERTSRAYEQVHPLKNMCQLKKPDVKTEIMVVEGGDRGPTIVGEAKKQGAGLLVIGQKKRSVRWRVIRLWAGSKLTGNGAVEYCIHNSECMAVAVRKKSKKLGGYLITTKRHRDFWLLA